MFVFFAGLVGLTFIVLLIWAGAMVYRLYNPEHSQSLAELPVLRRTEVSPREERVSVGVREIRADRRERRVRGDGREYVWGRSDGIPESWREELWTRRN